MPWRLERTMAVVLSALPIFTQGGQCAGAVRTESKDAYEIVMVAAVSSLPLPLRAYLEAHIDEVREGIAASTDSPRATGVAGEWAEQHYILFNAYASGSGRGIITPAVVRRFPRDRSAAERLFARRGQRHGGSLPWAVVASYDAFQDALRSGKGGHAALRAGELLHFATDAALPFNTIGIRLADAGKPTAAARNATRAILPDDDRRYRYHVRLIRQLRPRLEHEVRLWPQRVRPSVDPIETVFDSLFEAHLAIDELLSLERSLQYDRVADAAPMTDDDFLQQLADRAAPILESRLEAGAMLSAALMSSAWAQAGKPGLAVAAAAATAASDQPPGDDRGSGFVGSRHSTIVHHVRCQHARRIKPHNRVFFNAARDAQQVGRTPCKSCDPYGPS